jgi:hypothetical protein
VIASTSYQPSVSIASAETGDPDSDVDSGFRETVSEMRYWMARSRSKEGSNGVSRGIKPSYLASGCN